jgi:uncharacterized spore protein YtfJ
MGTTLRLVDTNEIVTAARDAMSVRRVFADPHVQDGVTVIPAAVVIGGRGAGSGQRSGGDAGDGGGFGVIALPVGAFTITGGRLRWRPAVNVNLLIVAATVVTVTYVRARSRTAGPR